MEEDLHKQVNALRFVHGALAAGVLMFLLVSFYLVNETGGFIQEIESFINLFLLIGNLISLIAILAGQVIFRNRIRQIRKLRFPEKLESYRAAMIVRAATIEGPAFLFIVSYMITGHWAFLLEAIAAFLLLLFFFPTNARLVSELQHDLNSNR